MSPVLFAALSGAFDGGFGPEDPFGLEAFTAGVPVAALGFGWWPGGWCWRASSAERSALGVGEGDPVGEVGVARDVEPATVVQLVMA